ncbi:MAG: cation transporter, partial [Halonotius sp.]
MSAQTTTLDITGMSCANCSATIEDSLADLDGVSDVTANYATDEATVEYDPGSVSLADLYAAVEEAGYGAVSETTRIGIADMSCANCADTNAEALESLPGV